MSEKSKSKPTPSRAKAAPKRPPPPTVDLSDPPPDTGTFPVLCSRCGARHPYPHGLCGACEYKRKEQARRVNADTDPRELPGIRVVSLG